MGLLVILPFLWIALLIDILFGDAVTGCKTTTKQKFYEHRELFVNLWNGGGA